MKKGDCFIWVQTSVYKKKVFVDDIIYCKVVDLVVNSKVPTILILIWKTCYPNASSAGAAFSKLSM